MFLIALAALAAPLQSNPVSCPVMGGPIDPKGVTAEYRGVRYQFCCDGCDTQFAKSPEKYIADQAKKGLTTGVFLYDPVSRLRVEPERAIPGFSDYRGTRYNFLTAEDTEGNSVITYNPNVATALKAARAGGVLE